MRNYFPLLQRHLLVQLLLALGAGLALYSLLFFIQNLFVLSEVIVERHASVSLSLRFIAFYFPKILAGVFPFAVLFASALVTNRLAATSQLAVINALGMSLKRQLAPYIALAIMGGLFYFAAIFSLVPWSKSNRDRIFQEISVHSITTGIQAGIVQEISPGVYLRTLQKAGTSRLKDVLLIQWPVGSSTPVLSMADSAEVRYQPPAHLALYLRHGTDYLPVKSRNDNGLRLEPLAFQEKAILLPVEELASQDDVPLGTDRRYSIRELNKLTALQFFAVLRQGDQNAAAVMLHRLLLILFVFTAPFLGFAMSYRLYRGAGLSASFLGSFLVGLLFVIGAKLVESIGTTRGVPAGIVVLLIIVFIYLRKLRDLQLKLYRRETRREKTKIRRGMGLTILSNIRKYMEIYAGSLDGFRGAPLVFRYVGSQVRRMITVSAVTLMGLFVILSSFSVLPKLLKGVLDVSSLGLFLWWTLVATLPYTLPLVFLIGVLIAVGILDGHSEIIAMKATGLSVFHMTTPIWRLSVGFVLALLFVNTYVAPIAQQHLTRIEQYGSYAKEGAQTGERTVGRVKITEDDPWAMVVMSPPALPEEDPGTEWVLKWDPKKDAMSWISVIRKRRDDEADVENRKPSYSPVVDWVWGSPNASDRKLIQSLRTMNLTDVQVDSLTSYRLRQMISDRKKVGAKPYGLITAYYARFSDAFTPVILLILGLPLMFMRTGRGSRVSGGMVTAMFLAILYYTGSAFFQSLGAVHYLPPFLAAWSMNILFGVIGLLLGTTVRT